MTTTPTTLDLEAALAGLGTTAPPRVGEAALVAVGLADEYAPI